MNKEQDIQNILERKPGAIEELINLHTQPLFACARGLGFSESDAEELVQDTFSSFLNAVERFEGRSKIRTYLFGILYNKASEMRRGKMREEATENMEEIFGKRFDARGQWGSFPRGPEEIALSKEVEGWIEECSEGLPLNQRTAFYLKEVERETTESICKILGVSVTHLGVLLFRARNNLRECLGKKMERK